MSRGKFAGWALFGLVFVIGAFTLAQQIGGLVSHFVNRQVSHVQTYNGAKSGTGGPDEPANLSQANFAYMLPGSSDAWKLDTGQSVYDPAKGIVKYQVTFNNAKADATITQQVFPGQLKPRGGDKFMAFVNNSKPTRSADVNGGTVYFLPALKNGAPANGTDTVIFARDDILMFGQSSSILGWDAWSQIMGSMQKAKAK